MSDAVSRRQIVRPRVIGVCEHKFIHITPHSDDFICGVLAVVSIANRVPWRHGQAGVLKRWIGLIDSAIDDSDAHPRSGIVHAAHRGPCSGCIHQRKGLIHLALNAHHLLNIFHARHGT